MSVSSIEKLWDETTRKIDGKRQVTYRVLDKITEEPLQFYYKNDQVMVKITQTSSM